MTKDTSPREINLSLCEEIGRGQCGSIYRTDKDTVVKLFYETIPKDSIITEYEKTCEASRLDINAVRCFGLITYEGKLGIELEMIKGKTIEEDMLENPELIPDYGVLMAKELKRIHSCKPDNTVFLPIHQFYHDCVSKCLSDGWITSSEAEKIEKFINAVPISETMIHGDYHILNLMTEGGRIRLIDLADCMSGNPVFDLLITNLYLHYMPVYLPDFCKVLVKVTPQQLLSCWEQFVRSYFGTENEKEIDRINTILNIYSMLKLILAPYSFSNLRKEDCAGIVETGRQGLMLFIDEYTGVLPF